jgi:hypothetical protein
MVCQEDGIQCSVFGIRYSVFGGTGFEEGRGMVSGLSV